ncbi:hypothetical protein [Pseudomonas sp. SWRI99]|uniref:hypothetical protein n=1 Tax=Pseudomonas sp. SWRI99 TaxID=2745506 RepID=UPI001EE36161|nr:hypothetical protein [Pseudomonas sp. SWRI99]
MQDQSHNGSVAEANAPRLRPTMASHRLDLPSICDICGKARSTRTHRSCSRIRQRRKADEWAALMAERIAARMSRGKRYSR